MKAIRMNEFGGPEVLKLEEIERPLPASEIAYELGCEHLQSFSKLFKTKTNFLPLAFRQSFT